MFRGYSMVLGALCLAFTCAGLASAAAPSYTITDLGVAPGWASTDDVDPAAINASGQVVGWAWTTAGGQLGFVYSGGMMTDIGTLNGMGMDTFARAINATGLVAGQSETSSGKLHAILFSHGTLTDLGTLGGAWSSASGVNNGGQVVGYSDTSAGIEHAMLYSNGTMTDLGSLAGATTASFAAGINANGQVAGWAGSDAFLYSSQTMTNLGTLPAPYNWSSEATAINNAGQVIGYSQGSGNNTHSFLFSNGAMSDLGTLPAPFNVGTFAEGINDLGQVVGRSWTLSLAEHAFLDNNGTMIDLENLLGPESGWTLSEAAGINDQGCIVGYGENPAGQARAFLLTPVPEPSAIALLLAGTACLLGSVWRRRKIGKRVLIVAALASGLMLATSITQAQVSNVFSMPAGQTSLQFVTVGDPGNALDWTTGLGSVPYAYQMGKYDVTVAQYVQFLNAVAKTDTYDLYNSDMVPGGAYPYGLPTIGIVQSGTSGSYSYSVAGSYSQAANCPIYDATWGDAARFCNWLQNGQPAFAVGTPGEVAGSTETGAYTLNGDTTSYMETRNPGATYVLPSLNEWYKAAYYKSGGTNAGYWEYPTRSNTVPSNVLSASGTNNASFSVNTAPYYSDPANSLTPVGAFSSSPALMAPMTWAAMSGSGTRRSSMVRSVVRGPGAGTTLSRAWPLPTTATPTPHSLTAALASAWQVLLSPNRPSSHFCSPLPPACWATHGGGENATRKQPFPAVS